MPNSTRNREFERGTSWVIAGNGGMTAVLTQWYIVFTLHKEDK